jgi:NACalpha-BTF3-like transcription factor
MEVKTAKDEFYGLMIEVFGMIEELDIQEGLYIQFGELFKQMGLNLDRLTQIQKVIFVNRYYHRYIRNPTINKKRLTQAQKAVHSDYVLCACGDYIHKDEQLHHIESTLKHKTGIRNRKYSAKKGDVNVDDEIQREIVLDGFCLRHDAKVRNIDERDI